MPDQSRPATLPPASLIRWPGAYAPARSVVHVQNEIVIPAAPEAIWPWLLRAELWPAWYPNSANIHFVSHAGPDLRDRSRFRWSKFGLPITSKVQEFVPFERIAWDSQGPGLDAWQAWLLTPLAPIDGQPRTHVLTEETQTGWLTGLGKLLMPNRLHRQHQIWLEALSRQAVESHAL